MIPQIYWQIGNRALNIKISYFRRVIRGSV